MSRPGPRFDLQSHSTYSDGALAPAEVVAGAHAAGVELLSLTDHDSVDGLGEAARAAAALGVSVVSGVEISTHDEAGSDLHILGYRFDAGNAALAEHLRGFRGEREARATRMAQALRELGFTVDDRRVRELAGDRGAIGRPHLAGAVVSDPANHARLAQEGHLDLSSFLEAYLIEGKPGFSQRIAPSVADAIALIHDAGGVAVWAHPFWDVKEPGEVLATIERFEAAGLDGVEVFYVTHTREQTLLLAEECERRGLLSTGSSDFHGPDHRLFSRFLAFETYGATPNLGPIADHG